jgi:choline dehydrogenase-like flavoprotein
MLEHPSSAAHVLENWRHCAVYYAMITGGTGTVRTVWPFRDPVVRYALGVTENIALASSLQRLCRCLLAAGAVCIYPVVRGLPPVRSEDDVRALPARLALEAANLMTIHLYGSCPMGEYRHHAVVDSFGRVHGVPGLIVSDASIFCGSLGVNPQGTVMAFARRNACHFLETENDG